LHLKTVQGTARNIERKALNGKNAPITNIARKNNSHHPPMIGGFYFGRT
jgi:hypothetical protein